MGIGCGGAVVGIGAGIPKHDCVGLCATGGSGGSDRGRPRDSYALEVFRHLRGHVLIAGGFLD